MLAEKLISDYFSLYFSILPSTEGLKGAKLKSIIYLVVKSTSGFSLFLEEKKNNVYVP